LNSDNDGPMRSATLQGTLQTLGIAPLFNRSPTSNDNAFSHQYLEHYVLSYISYRGIWKAWRWANLGIKIYSLVSQWTPAEWLKLCDA